MTLHLIKLCVGCDTVEELLAWRAEGRARDLPWILRTRQTPKRSQDLLDGGSLYRVYKGLILSRQVILGIQTTGEGVARRCEIRLDETVVLTTPTPRRPFQGWRYFTPGDAPVDLEVIGGESAVPLDLAIRLRDVGAW